MAQQVAPKISPIDAPALRPASPRRAEMIRVAARLFSERGYHGTSMQHLGEALGLLRGSLYAHIGSKEELLYEVVDMGAERFLERARNAVDGPGDAPDKLTALLVGHVETAIEHLEAATVFLNEWRYLSSERRALVRQKRDEYEEIIKRVIAEGIEKGELRQDLDTALTARLVLSAGNWTYTWYHPGGPLTPTQVGLTFADTIIRGLKPTQEQLDPRESIAKEAS